MPTGRARMIARSRAISPSRVDKKAGSCNGGEEDFSCSPFMVHFDYGRQSGGVEQYIYPHLYRARSSNHAFCEQDTVTQVHIQYTKTWKCAECFTFWLSMYRQ